MISAFLTITLLDSLRKGNTKHLTTFPERSKYRILQIIILIYYPATKTKPLDKIKWLNQTIYYRKLEYEWGEWLDMKLHQSRYSRKMHFKKYIYRPTWMHNPFRYLRVTNLLWASLGRLWSLGLFSLLCLSEIHGFQTVCLDSMGIFQSCSGRVEQGRGQSTASQWLVFISHPTSSRKLCL